MSATAPPPLEALADTYIELAIHLHQLIGRLSGHICADCPSPCCNEGHCSSLAESGWLRFVAHRAGATLPATTPYNFLGPKGCALAAGRPIVCTAYICDRLALAIRDPLERFVYQVASDVLPYIARNLTRAKDLTDVEDIDRLTDAQRRRIATRIGNAREAIRRVDYFLEQRDESAPIGETVEAMLHVVRTFPYSAGQVRFEGETPSLSRAGRKKLEQP